MANRGRPPKAAAAPTPEEPIEEILEGAAEPSIDFADAEEPATKGNLVEDLKSKISGFFKSDPVDFEGVEEEPKRGRGRPPKQAKTTAADEFMSIALPLTTMALTFILSAPFKGAYTPCAPSKAETQSIALPPLRMLARRMKFEKMSPDMWDLSLLLVAIATYGERAIMTAREINQLQLERQGGYGNDRGDTNRGSIDPAANGHARHDRSNGYVPGTGAGQGDVFSAPAKNEAESAQDEASGVALIHDLLEQDALGRKRWGLGQ